jgi:hypothetical protein
MVRKSLFLSVCFLLFVLFIGYAEVLTTVTISGSTTLFHEENTNFGWYTMGQTRLDLRSAGNKNVKGQLQVDAGYNGEEGEIYGDIHRAYIRVRFNVFLLTIGKTRVTWGDGFLFNAGDLIFEGISFPSDISTQSMESTNEMRFSTDWLLAIKFPIGLYSFIEGVFFPHPKMGKTSNGFYYPDFTDFHDVEAGLRGLTKIVNVKVEGGYLYKGSKSIRNSTHNLYMSFNGPIVKWNWHLSTSIAIPAKDPDGDEIGDSWAVSFGLLRIISFSNNGNLTLRLETAIRPLGHWRERNPSPSDTEYGLYLFPEIVLSPMDNLAISIRSLFSAIDLSALNSISVDWNIFQGFTMSTMFTIRCGDSNDHFKWGKAGDFFFTLYFKYIFGSA